LPTLVDEEELDVPPLIASKCHQHFGNNKNTLSKGKKFFSLFIGHSASG